MTALTYSEDDDGAERTPGFKKGAFQYIHCNLCNHMLEGLVYVYIFIYVLVCGV